MPIRKLALSALAMLVITTAAYAQGGGAGGASGAGSGAAAGTGGTSASQGKTGGTTAGNRAAGENSQQQTDQIRRNEKNAATSGTNTQPSSSESGTVSAPGVGVGHAANGKPIGTPGSGLGSPEDSAGPTTATGPVTIWGPMRSGFASWIRRSASGMTRPLSGFGMTSGPPETHSISTLSPEFIFSTAGNAASKMPKRVVSGAAFRTRVAKFPSMSFAP